MSVNIEDDVVDVISCVALFHEKGKSGNSFLRKRNFGHIFHGRRGHSSPSVD